MKFLKLKFFFFKFQNFKFFSEDFIKFQNYKTKKKIHITPHHVIRHTLLHPSPHAIRIRSLHPWEICLVAFRIYLIFKIKHILSKYMINDFMPHLLYNIKFRDLGWLFNSMLISFSHILLHYLCPMYGDIIILEHIIIIWEWRAITGQTGLSMTSIYYLH